MILTSKAEALTLSFEGWDVPWKWQGGASGITIPIGYDIGYDPFETDWAGLLSGDDYQRLKQVQGVTGTKARDAAPHMRGIIIPHEAALKVFRGVTIPRYAVLTKKVFPGSGLLPRDAFGALWDLVFNRGDSLDGPRRVEMSRIKQICETYIPANIQTARREISDQILAMRRLWADTPSDADLYDRRTQEAELVWPTKISVASAG